MSHSDIMDEVSGLTADTFDYPKPLYCYLNRIDDEKTILEWARKARTSAIKAAHTRNQNIITNLALYRGEVKKLGGGKDTGSYSRLSEVPEISTTAPETQYIVVNELHQHTEVRVARFSRYRDNIEVLPANSDESSDKNSARLVKELITYLRYVTDFKQCLQHLGRRMIVCGEAYIAVEWDPEKGEMLPEVVTSLQETGKPPQLADEMGQEMPLPESKWRMGEVSFRVPRTANMFPEPVIDGNYDKITWIMERELVHVEELKRRYPQKASEIKEDVFDTDDAKMIAHIWEKDWDGKVPKGFVWCHYLWHKKTPFLPEGRLIVFTNSTLLKNDVHPYEHKQLPYIRITDVDDDGKLYGHAQFSMARNLNGLLNNVYSLIYRYHVLLTPRWGYPENARVTPEMLGNELLALKYSGAVAPHIIHATPISTELFAFAQQLKENLREQMTVFPMAAGNVPPNIRAGVSMLFMDEQENERFDVEAKKHNQALLDTWRLALEVIRQYYPKDEQRKIAIFGAGEAVTMKDFDPTILNTPFEIRLQNAPSLPESKAARTQYLLDIDERKPLPPDQFFEYLDLGIPDAYTNEITKAKKAADFENEEAAKGNVLDLPQKYTDHIAHLIRHYILLQDRAFLTLDPNVQNAFLEHVRMHEAYVMEQTFVDYDMSQPLHPGKAEILMQMPLFPSVFAPNTDRQRAQVALQDAQMESAGMAPPMAGPEAGGGMPINEAPPQAPMLSSDMFGGTSEDTAKGDETMAPDNSGY